MNDLVPRLRSNLAAVIRGKPREIDFLVLALLGGGNVLLTDVPGVGKTTLARAMAASIAGTFRRIQFTPDLLPADVLGGSIYNPKDGSFAFRRGPIFTQICLADEINRATPKTQSAMLETMQEGSVSIGGKVHQLKQPFFVMATRLSLRTARRAVRTRSEHIQALLHFGRKHRTPGRAAENT